VERRRAPPVSTSDTSIAATPGLSPEITPNDRFYVVDEEIIDPDIDPAGWRVSVKGNVDRPFLLGYDELTSMPAVERFQTLQCISNPVGGPLISNAKWTGVPLRDLLERAGMRPGAREVVFRQFEGDYSDSLSLAAAAAPAVLVALGMNDHVLPREHGFPARVLIPGVYGMKMVKWLGEIEVVDVPHAGYWERRGWSKEAVVKTMSRIDTPDDGADLAPACRGWR
jgi:DMSO/TMAO reductase YedYZ molybdopterin-dependent catalytic subunit